MLIPQIKMGVRHSSIAPEPRAPPSSHRRADGLAQAREVAREVTRSRPQSMVEALAAERSECYGALSDVEDDGRLAGASEQAGNACKARQLAILSEVSVVGQEFGWPQRSPVSSTHSPDLEAAAGKSVEPAAGVFGHNDCQRIISRNRGGLQSGRDTAMELRCFMQSSTGHHSASNNSGSEEDEDCLRSPALLKDWDPPDGQGAESHRRGRRPASAPLVVKGASVEVELRREIAASKARTKLHMRPWN